MRVNAGWLAAPLGKICHETGLNAEEVSQSLKFGKSIGVFNVKPTPWALRIEIVNWQEYLQADAVRGLNRVKTLPPTE